MMFTLWFWDLRLERAAQDKMFDNDSDIVEYILLSFFAISQLKELGQLVISCERHGMKMGVWMQMNDVVCHPSICLVTELSIEFCCGEIFH